jgi:hypothetical protein
MMSDRIGVVVVANRHALLQDGRWVAVFTLPILVSHQTEEWVRPGGFLPFCNQQLLGSDQPDWPLTERDGSTSTSRWAGPAHSSASIVLPRSSTR